MSYEVLIATGTDKGADADSRLDMALVYIDDNGQEQTSDFFEKIGNTSNRNDAFENGQLDICSPVKFMKNGQEIKTDNFIAVKIAFHDKDWQLDTIWVTNRETGKYFWKESGKFFGSKYDVGTDKNPYTLHLDGPVNMDGSAQNQITFDLNVRTQSGSGNGTNDNVFFKLFDTKGCASATSRNAQEMANSFQPGASSSLRGFSTQFGSLTKTISEVLIIKVGNDGWKPEYMEVQPSGLSDGNTSRFDLEGHLPSQGSLDTGHNWMKAPNKDLNSRTYDQNELTTSINE